MPALSTAQFAGVRARFNDSANAFFVWWLRELLTCIPARWRAAFAVDARSRVLRLCDDGLELRDVRHRLGKPARDTVVVAGDAATVVALARRGRRALAHIVPLYLRVPFALCLVRTVVVPVTALRRLNDVLALDLERTTPFKRHDVFSAACVLETSALHASQVPVTHIVFKASQIETVLQILNAARIDCAGIEVESFDGAVLPVRLVRGGTARAPVPRALAYLSKIVAILLIGVTLLSSALLALALYKREQALASLRTETSALQKRVGATRQRLGAAQSALAEVAGPRLRKIEASGLLQVLEELSRVLPDEAWIGELQLTKDGIVIDGNARTAAELIGLISAAPNFRDVAFAAPVTRDTGKGLERFRIRFKADRAQGGRT